MSLLVRYTLASADHHDHQVDAMAALVAALTTEGVPIAYSCFSTDDPVEFIGLMEFDSESDFQAFQKSAAFAAYREKVGPTFANPPQTTRISGVASTRG